MANGRLTLDSLRINVGAMTESDLNCEAKTDRCGEGEGFFVLESTEGIAKAGNASEFKFRAY